MYLVDDHSTVQSLQTKGFLGMFLMSVFLRMMSVTVVALISSTTYCGKALSYHKLSPSRMPLNWTAATVAPNSPYIESSSLFSPRTPT